MFVRDLATPLIGTIEIKGNIDSISPFQPNVMFHIETSHLFCRAKQMTGFYMKRNTRQKFVKYRNFVFLQNINICSFLGIDLT